MHPEEVVLSVLSQAPSSLPMRREGATSVSSLRRRRRGEEERRKEVELAAREKFEANKSWQLKMRERMLSLSILSVKDGKKKKRKQKR